LAAALIRKVEEQYPNISLHIIEAMTGTLDEWMQTARTVRCNSNHGPDAILAAFGGRIARDNQHVFK
jgi:hypothetical protein